MADAETAKSIETCREYRVMLGAIIKKGKAPRDVLDESFLRVTTNAVFGHIIGFVLFGEHPEVSEPAILQPNGSQLKREEKHKKVRCHISPRSTSFATRSSTTIRLGSK